MLGWGRKAAVEERAKLLVRMIALIMRGLQTKSYEEFIQAFANPDAVPDAFERLSRKLDFQMRISPTCWYDATASYSSDEPPSVILQGGGDDFGVFITASLSAGITVDPHLAPGQKAGRDALAVVRCLHAVPGFKSFAAIERSLGI
jgi:hypothetical protein